MNEAFLCLGGNLGNRAKLLESCKALVNEQCGRIVKESKIYETDAWGSDSKKRFLNQVIRIKTKFDATQLIDLLLGIETLLGRKRNAHKNSDRTMDIDILFFNKEIIKRKDLEVPHPRLHLRNFVLKPLMDVDAKFVHPVLKKTIKKIYGACKDELKAVEFLPVKKNAIKFICIEGNIGSGKTTLAKALATDLGARFLPEEFEKNNLLPLFYKEPKTFSFPLEYSFLLNRYQNISDVFDGKTDFVISDYSFYKCVWFAKLNLSKKDFLYFKKHFAALEQQLQKPDLIIYLDTSLKNIKQNIKTRGRSYELNLSDNYLNAIGGQYVRGLKRMNGVEILILPVKAYNPGLKAALIKTIKKHLDKRLNS